MPDHHSKGKVGPDGVTRYYVPSQHAWLTHQEIEEQNKAEKTSDSVFTLLSIIVGGGALLYMLIVTLSSL